MNHDRSSYQIDIPQDTEVVVFYNGIKALNVRGWLWLWQGILTANSAKVKNVPGCVEAKLGICSPKEVVIVSYWQNEKSLIEFFHSPLHRQMMKSMMKIVAADPKAIAVFNETYRPLRSGRYLNEPQGLAKIYPAIDPVKAVAR